MKERPILFSAPMVRAILEGRKTQTRRVVKYEWHHGCLTGDCNHDKQSQCDAALLEYGNSECPHGKPGDRLWVREAWRTGSELNEWNASEIAAKCLDAGYKSPGAPTFYIADSTTRAWGDMDKEDFGDWGRYRHPRFMPRWASRILLEITEVRVQRLEEIGQEDAVSEGLEVLQGDHSNGLFWDGPGYHDHVSRGSVSKEKTYHVGKLAGICSCKEGQRLNLTPARCAYRILWESINGSGSWSANPWVWAITFKQVQP